MKSLKRSLLITKKCSMNFSRDSSKKINWGKRTFGILIWWSILRLVAENSWNDEQRVNLHYQQLIGSVLNRLEGMSHSSQSNEESENYLQLKRSIEAALRQNFCLWIKQKILLSSETVEFFLDGFIAPIYWQRRTLYRGLSLNLESFE